ncbi:MAG: L-histidine N(alpha)-methyltransferase [Phycisphaerae bacterium]
MTIIDLLDEDDLEASLRAYLARGEMPDAFLYLGSDGADHWLDLDGSPSFDVASDLTDLLRDHASAVASHVPAGASVVGLGVGRGDKERILLEALPADAGRRYLAADVSRPLVEAALETVADLPVEAMGATARIEDWPRLRRHVRPPVLVCLLGNTFSNFEPDRLLKRVRADLGPSDLFLFDCSLGPAAEEREAEWRQAVERAYRSAENARFNLGPLTARGLPEDAGRFALRLVRVPTRLGPTWRTRKSVEVLRDAEVAFPEGPVRLRAGDVVHMGFTYKHTRRQVFRWVQEARFRIVEAFTDATKSNLLILVR